jgi:hypothetical protein
MIICFRSKDMNCASDPRIMLGLEFGYHVHHNFPENPRHKINTALRMLVLIWYLWMIFFSMLIWPLIWKSIKLGREYRHYEMIDITDYTHWKVSMSWLLLTLFLLTTEFYFSHANCSQFMWSPVHQICCSAWYLFQIPMASPRPYDGWNILSPRYQEPNQHLYEIAGKYEVDCFGLTGCGLNFFNLTRLPCCGARRSCHLRSGGLFVVVAFNVFAGPVGTIPLFSKALERSPHDGAFLVQKAFAGLGSLIIFTAVVCDLRLHSMERILFFRYVFGSRLRI